MSLPLLRWQAGEEPEQLRRILARLDGPSPEVNRRVLSIIGRVRAEGDAALLALARELDGVELEGTALRVDRDELGRLAAGLDPELLAALEQLADTLRRGHEGQRCADTLVEDGDGGSVLRRVGPVDSVGIYVPGGEATAPTSLLMCAVPAGLAGVPRIVAVTPPGALERSPALAAALQIAGVDEVYRVGGAQAVAALAFGTETIAPVTKVVGPGNLWVAAAKRICEGRVGVDAYTGPSELVVVADPETPPAWIAADLLAQAEHDALASAVAVVWDAAQAEAVVAEVDRQLADLPRRAVVEQALAQRGGVFVVLGPEAACRLADRIAPQAVELLVEEPAELAGRIHRTAAIFLGRYSPQAIGDYAAGSNHVLPAGGTARFASPLGVGDFLKTTQLVAFSAARLGGAREAAARLARSEGFEAHARSLELRGALED